MSFFRGPLCSAPLTRGERAYTCPAGHSFDRSAAGYVVGEWEGRLAV